MASDETNVQHEPQCIALAAGIENGTHRLVVQYAKYLTMIRFAYLRQGVEKF